MKKKRILLLVLLVGLMVFALGIGCAYSEDVTWNPNDKGEGITLSDDNLIVNPPSGASMRGVRATQGTSSGKHYWEIKVTGSAVGLYNGGPVILAVGAVTPDHTLTEVPLYANSYVFADAKFGISIDGTQYGYQNYKFVNNDIIGIALDMDNKNISFYKNGVQQGNVYSVNANHNILYPYAYIYGSEYPGYAEANFGATPFVYPIPEGYQTYNESAAPATKTLDVTAVDSVSVGNAIAADVVINGATNIYAEDIKVTYDTALLTYVDYTEISGLKVFSATESTPGTLRFIVASQGEANVVNGTKTLLTLNFTAKAAGEALVDITTGRIADTTQETDVTADQCGEKTITIEGATDVNRSGEFTLLDLAIDAWYHGKTVAETDNTLYDADVIVDTNIDDLDLTEIVNRMLQNTNYAPNNS